MFFGRNSSPEAAQTSPTDEFLHSLQEHLNGLPGASKLRKTVDRVLKRTETEKIRRLPGLYLEVETCLAGQTSNSLERRIQFRQEISESFPELQDIPEFALVTQKKKSASVAATPAAPAPPAPSDQAALRKVILETTSEGIIAMNEDGSIIMVNPAFEKIWGHSKEELIGREFVSLLPKDLRKAYDSGLKRFLGVPLELEGLRKNGQRFPISVNISSAEFNERKILTVSVQDITMRKYIEQDLVHSKDELEDRVAERTKDLLETQKDLENRARELERTNTELQQFAYVASHDLQEPLRSITSFIQILNRRHGAEMGEEAKEYMEFVVDGAKRMQDLINELLDYSRAGRVDRDFQEVDLNAVLAQVRTNLHASISQSGATLEAQKLPKLTADARQMAQLFQNLIENGIKFHGEEPPQISVEYQDRVTHWEFMISDNGIGIEDKYKDRIFIIFQRLHTRDSYPGNGIGLAICKKIVERHGGFISLDTGYHPGARFVFGIAKDLTGG